jgi:hypothetical protein
MKMISLLGEEFEQKCFYLPCGEPQGYGKMILSIECMKYFEV